MTFPSGPRQAELFRRLRARPVSAWQHGDREAVMRSSLQQLADLAADLSGEPHRPVPDAGAVALVDQLIVLTAEARSAGVPEEVLDSLLDDLSGRLAIR